MAVLARAGCCVLGKDGVAKLLDDFVAEHTVPLPHGAKTMVVHLPPAVEPRKLQARAALLAAAEDEDVRVSICSPVILVEGDFLRISPREAEALVPFGAVYDRCGLTAVAPADREMYAQVHTCLVQVGGRVLLVAVEDEECPHRTTLPSVRI